MEEKYEYVYTKTDVDLSIYDMFNKNPTVREIMDELERDCILEERETIQTHTIYKLPRIFSKFRCPIGTKAKCESYNTNIFTSTDERDWTKRRLAREQKAYQDYRDEIDSHYGICAICVMI